MLLVEALPPAGHLGNAQLRCRGGFVRRRRPSELDEEAVRHVSESKIALIHGITHRSEVEPGQIELIRLRGSDLRDREILDC